MLLSWHGTNVLCCCLLLCCALSPSVQVQTGVRLILLGGLAKHAVSEGTKALTEFTSASAGSVVVPFLLPPGR